MPKNGPTGLEKAADDLKEALDGFLEALFDAVADDSSEEAEPPARASSRKKTGTRKKTAASKKKTSSRKKPEGPTIEDVRKALMEVQEEFGKDGQLDVLEEFEVTKVSELQESQYAAVIAEAKAYLEEEDGDGDEDDSDDD